VAHAIRSEDENYCMPSPPAKTAQARQQQIQVSDAAARASAAVPSTLPPQASARRPPSPEAYAEAAGDSQ